MADLNSPEFPGPDNARADLGSFENDPETTTQIRKILDPSTSPKKPEAVIRAKETAVAEARARLKEAADRANDQSVA